MTSKEIRKQFFEYFEKKKHKIVPSAPVVPFDDPTLLFTNAGMNQFKDVFLGQGKRDYTRAADTQKCIRVSGKHNDLEEVGHDTYHHTFFEMLGNWSFGDYYKKEAIEWAWDLLTNVWGLPKERLYATVYKTDEEALELWKEVTDINHNHILKFAEKDNFWEMGETGPCGPCSEIHINLSDNPDDASLVNADSPLCIEIWNLVFIQYYRDSEGTLHDLPKKHIDTGMGFERLCAVMQGKKSNYDTDVFMPLINRIAEISGRPYQAEKDQIAMRVIADHVRTLTVAIADGAAPGNEGRSYVLRRILRRAARYGRELNLNEPFMFKLVDVVAGQLGDVFPEIAERLDNIKNIIRGEEESFNATLDRGIELFEKISSEAVAAGQKRISGEDVFKLYDTFGFPFDLTAVMAREKGLAIDEAGFNTLMDEQKERARKSTKEKLAAAGLDSESFENLDLSGIPDTEFTGYTETITSAKILWAGERGESMLVVLDKSPFYVESGGQVSDKGQLVKDGKMYDIKGLLKIDGKTVHIIEKSYIEFNPGDEVIAEIDEEYRNHIRRNHSVTHLLHTALRSVLGPHVRQAGSYVGPERLRFDFTHFEKLSAEQIEEIESVVNHQIRRNMNLEHYLAIPFDEAKKMGALMFFGDKYGDAVNVVRFGDYSMEFCGGTHVGNSSEIGMFKIISESSVAAGVRRIEAVTGAGVEEYISNLQTEILTAKEKIAQLADEKKKLEKEINELKLQEKLGGIDKIMEEPLDIYGVSLFKGRVEASSMDELKSMGDEIREKGKNAIGLLISELNEKVGIVCVVTDDLVEKKIAAAGKIVGDVARLVGGGGGGRPHMATAGGKDISKIDEALEQVDGIVEKHLKA